MERHLPKEGWMVGNGSQRANQKLRYAEIQVAELAAYRHATSNDEWENAHQEACFYHLVGAVEALLQELNRAYCLGLEMRHVTWKTIADSLRGSGKCSPAFEHLEQLRKDESSWLALLFEWRNLGTHRRKVGKTVWASTSETRDNEFRDPRPGEPSTAYVGLGCQATLEQQLRDVGGLVDQCRELDPTLRSDVR